MSNKEITKKILIHFICGFIFMIITISFANLNFDFRTWKADQRILVFALPGMFVLIEYILLKIDS